jgi:signal transduction histidine kinase
VTSDSTSQQLASGDASASASGRPVHPRLKALIAELDRSDLRAGPAWARLVESVNAESWNAEALRTDLARSLRGWTSFENLFRISPIPIMEQDYTELERWMEALRAQGVTSIREYLGGDIEAIRAVVPMIWIVAANPAAVRAVGLPLDQLIGPVDPVIVNDGSEPGWLNQLDAVWNRRAVSQASFTASTANAEPYDADSILAVPVVDGEPDFSRAVFTLLDTTAHRNEERRMIELMEEKNRFLASVSHEIRTPLTAILGFAQLIDETEDLDDGTRDLMIGSIVQQAREMADLVDDLLVAARAEAGTIEVADTVVDVLEQIDQTLRAGGSFTSGVRAERPVELPEAMGDPARVRQILRNLLTNAERYGGADVVVVASLEGDRVVISVSDNGPGLPTEEWERIFQLYERAHERPGRTESVGIGLTISRQLAELMGGGLDYRHDSGRSIFRLSLRIAPGAPVDRSPCP